MKNIILTTLLIAALCGACSKEEASTEPVPRTKDDILIQENIFNCDLSTNYSIYSTHYIPHNSSGKWAYYFETYEDYTQAITKFRKKLATATSNVFSFLMLENAASIILKAKVGSYSTTDLNIETRSDLFDLQNVDIPITVEKVYKWRDVVQSDILYNPQNIPVQGSLLEIKLSKEYLFYDKENIGVGELLNNITNFRHDVSAAKDQIMHSYVRENIGEAEMIMQLEELEAFEKSNPLYVEKAIIERKYFDGTLLNALCGFDYLKPGNEYLFLLMSDGGGKLKPISGSSIFNKVSHEEIEELMDMSLFKEYEYSDNKVRERLIKHIRDNKEYIDKKLLERVKTENN